MWKKATWVYLVIYAIGILLLFFNRTNQNSEANGFELSSLVTILVFLLPAVFVGLELRGKKVFVLFHILAILFIAFMILGIFNFNTISLETIGKGLLFIPMIAALGYYGFNGLKKKKVEQTPIA